MYTHNTSILSLVEVFMLKESLRRRRELSVSGVTVKFTAAPYTTTTPTIAVTAIAVTAIPVTRVSDVMGGRLNLIL